VEAQTPGQKAQGARCALHEGKPFTAVCRRCGTYMCEQCTEGGQFVVCPECRERAGLSRFPLRRDGFRWLELPAFAFGIYRRHWLLLTAALLLVVVGMALVQGASFIVQLVLADRLWFALVLQTLLVVPQVLVQGVLTLGLLTLAVRVTRGEPADLSLLVTCYRKLGSFLLQGLLLNVALLPAVVLALLPVGIVFFLLPDASSVATTTLALTIPLVLIALAYVGLGVAFASLEIVAQPQVGAVDGIKNSWAIARDHRLGILGCGALGVFAILLTAMACGVGALFGFGYALVLYATVYLTLRNGAPGLSE
jgi:hypothetical protein